MRVTSDKAENLATAAAYIKRAKEAGASLVVLPEYFNCPFGEKHFPVYAEDFGDSSNCPTVHAMKTAAKELGVWIVAGSIPEIDGGKYYNSTMTIGPDGAIHGLHRKVHLFKINTPTVKVDEGEVITKGETVTPVEVCGGVKMGVGICFDIRFPQMALRYAELGTQLLVYPSAFSMVTGPAHWELSTRCRAVDSQQFVAICSGARDTSADYVVWGHSMIADPWGTVVAEAGEGEELVVADLDLAKVAEVRQKLPILSGQRSDMYTLQWKK